MPRLRLTLDLLTLLFLLCSCPLIARSLSQQLKNDSSDLRATFDLILDRLGPDRNLNAVNLVTTNATGFIHWGQFPRDDACEFIHVNPRTWDTVEHGIGEVRWVKGGPVYRIPVCLFNHTHWKKNHCYPIGNIEARQWLGAMGRWRSVILAWEAANDSKPFNLTGFGEVENMNTTDLTCNNAVLSWNCWTGTCHPQSFKCVFKKSNSKRVSKVLDFHNLTKVKMSCIGSYVKTSRGLELLGLGMTLLSARLSSF